MAKTLTNNPPIRIHVNIIENINTFELGTCSYLEPLIPKTVKLLERRENKIIKERNGETMR